MHRYPAILLINPGYSRCSLQRNSFLLTGEIRWYKQGHDHLIIGLKSSPIPGFDKRSIGTYILRHSAHRRVQPHLEET